MDYLGTMFLILTPFGFFCTENGTGMITGFVFLILGLLFKWLAKNGNNISSTPTAKYQVSPEEFWKIHFKEQYDKSKSSDEYGKKHNDIKAESARRWADEIITAERLKADETRIFVDNSFCDGELILTVSCHQCPGSAVTIER